MNGRGETSRYHEADAAIKAARSLVSGKEFRASRLGRNPRFKPLSSCRRTSFHRVRFSAIALIYVADNVPADSRTQQGDSRWDDFEARLAPTTLPTRG
jgi:hypothetical protein